MFIRWFFRAAIALAGAAAVLFFAAPAPAQTVAVDVELVLAVDVSASIDAEEGKDLTQRTLVELVVDDDAKQIPSEPLQIRLQIADVVTALHVREGMGAQLRKGLGPDPLFLPLDRIGELEGLETVLSLETVVRQGPLDGVAKDEQDP